ncbi:hypothetical protein M0Q97_10855, partial [Candidatus Dojkabacteria bacterium]|nr:hypothetical protein [Candidatus Dojkabacteria bacterium]
MKKILTILSFIFLLFINSTYAQVLTQNDLVEASKIVNSMCPMMVDEITRLDYTSVPSYFTVEYNYTLVSILKESLNIDIFKTTQENILIEGVRKNTDLKPLRDNNVTFKYTYYDKLHKLMFTCTITPEKYNL